MRICLIYLGRRGGGGPFSYELATHLSHHGSVLAVLSNQLEGLAVWQASGLEIIATSTYRSTLGAIIAWFNHLSLRRLVSSIRAWKPDILIYPLFYTLNPFLQMHLRDIPSLVAVHDVNPHPGLRDWVYHRIENLSIRQATRCVVLSEAFRPVLQQRGVPKDRIDHIPHPSLSSYYRKFMQDHLSQPSDSTDTTLLFFGRITAYKGLEVLLEAYEQVCRRWPVRLQIVGEGDLRPFQRSINGLPNVEVINHWIEEQDIHRYFAAARILVVPYTSASQSGVIAVAAEFGLPVITTHTGGLAEQIRHGETGLLVAPKDVNGLIQAIECLLQSPEVARTLGQNLRREYQTVCTWDIAAGRTYETCERAIGDFGRSGA
jgi:glycosyltransferase involved in cell wall biosynthesis